MVETMNEMLNVVLLGAAMVLALAVLGFVISILLVIHAWLKGKLGQYDADPRVLAFGQSPVGNVVNQYLRDLVPQVDSPDDPLIQAAASIQFLRRAQLNKLLTPEQLSKFAVDILHQGITLTDGIPNVAIQYQVQSSDVSTDA